MSDPIRDLENFSTGGTPMTPLPASEVRRRGDRLRRRNTTLLSVAGAVAVAAIVATPLALSGGKDKAGPDTGFATQTPSASATTSGDVGTAWLAEVPKDFPLEEGYPADNEDGTPVSVKDVDAPELFSVCDAYVTFGDDMLDEATVTYSAPEDERNRWLAVYPDADTADRALGAISSVIEGCPVEEVKGTETVLTPFASTLGERSFAWTSRYRTGGSFDVGLAVFQAVRVGNAVLLDTNYGEGGATTDSIGKVARAVATDAVPVVKAMDVFAEEPSTVAPPPESSSSDPGPSTSDGIPADFPIDVDLVSPEGDELIGPGADAEGVRKAVLCEEPVWPAGGEARLAVTATGPEYYEAREVVRHASVADAVAVMDALRRAVRGCADEPVGGGVSYLTREVDADTGYDTLAFTRAVDQGLGGEVYVFTRVGTAVLGVMTSGEYTPDNVAGAVPDLVATTDKITPAMCTFTAAGC